MAHLLGSIMKLVLVAIIVLPAASMIADAQSQHITRKQIDQSVDTAKNIALGTSSAGGPQTFPASNAPFALGDRTVSGWDNFGVPALQVGGRGMRNAIVGISDNGGNAPACSSGNPNHNCAFPTGVTGLGTLTSAGNQTFGIYGVGKTNTAGTASAIELTALNNTKWPADRSLPPDTAFGTRTVVPLAATLGCAGTATCSLAMRIVQDGAMPSQFENGIYTAPKSILGYGLFFDATAADGMRTPIFIKTTGLGIAHNILVVGTYASDNSVFHVSNTTNANYFTIKQSGAFGNSSWMFKADGTATGAPNTSIGLAADGKGQTRLGSAGEAGSATVVLGAYANAALTVRKLSTAFTLAFEPNQDLVVIEGSGDLENGTVILPDAPMNGQRATIVCGVFVRKMRISTSSMLRAPSLMSCEPGIGQRFVYADDRWYGMR